MNWLIEHEIQIRGLIFLTAIAYCVWAIWDNGRKKK